MTVYTIIKDKNIRDKKMELAKLGDVYYVKVKNDHNLVIWARVFPLLRLANKCWRRVYNCLNYGIDLDEEIE